MKHLGTKTIETDRLILRQFVKEDANAMYRNWASDPEVIKYLTWPVHTDVSVSEWVISDWVHSYANEKYYQWAIGLKERDGEPIGSISVVRMNEEASVAEIGYCIGQKWWHQGITSEALKAVIDFLFDEVEFQQIEARHDTNNPHSGNVMRKCGMKYQKTLKNADKNNQGICDASYYTLAKEER